MKKMKILLCYSMCALLLVSAFPINTFADEAPIEDETQIKDETTPEPTQEVTPEPTKEVEIGEPITVTPVVDEPTKEPIVDEVTPEPTKEPVADETTPEPTGTITTEKLGSLSIVAPPVIPEQVDGKYVINFTVNNDNDLEGLRFIKGKADFNSWDSATPCNTTLEIPVEESDSWYTIIGKDVVGNIAFTSIYVHCEKEDEKPTTTPEPTKELEVNELTVTPMPPQKVPPMKDTNTCPDGYTMKDDGKCYSNTPTCPDGYQDNGSGVCVQIPTVANKEGCPEGQYLDENGTCVDKITSLPQTGGFDSLMMTFVFGVGLAACGAGVVAYANQKQKNDKKED